MTILITGAAGYIGSHVARAAAAAGRRVIAFDDLSGAPAWPRLPADIHCVRGDASDTTLVTRLVTEHQVDAVVHLAGRSRVEESVADPAGYFVANVVQSSVLLAAALAAGVRSFVFSSSAAVYGSPAEDPIGESAPTRPLNPYGETKLSVERLLEGWGRNGLTWAALRYFNAAGAHPDGSLREAHVPETHLIPRAIDAALGLGPSIVVCGADYPTHDGTAARDYVHVGDLARAHLSALAALERGDRVGAVNLGSGTSATVREVLAAVERVTGGRVPVAVGPRRVGDPPVLRAAIGYAREALGWVPERSSLEVIVEDAVRARI